VGATVPISMLQVMLALAALIVLILPVLYAEKRIKDGYLIFSFA
jgi:hypothetical protein